MGLQTCGLNRSHTQKELQPHGTVEFPCAAYTSRHTDAPGDTIPWHWHEELEVIFVAAGTLKLQIPGGEYLLQEGSLVVLNGNVLHSLSGHPAGALRSMVFSPFLITGGADTVFYKNYVRALLACPDFSVWQAEPGTDVKRFSAAFSAMETDAFAYEFTVRENLSQLLLHCYAQLLPRLSAQKPAKSADTVRIEQMLQYMQASYAEPITLADIAQAAGLSERECLRCFHRTIGDSPVQYLLKYRLMQGRRSAPRLARRQHRRSFRRLRLRQPQLLLQTVPPLLPTPPAGVPDGWTINKILGSSSTISRINSA